MEFRTVFMAFFIITTLVSFAYPSLAREDVDDEPLVNPGREMDAVEVISPASQDYNFNMLHNNLSQKYLMYLGSCKEKMERSSKKCTNDVIEEILTKKHVSRDCCLKVVKAGKECYMGIRKVMFRFAPQVSFRTNQVWNRCSAEVQIPSPSHS